MSQQYQETSTKLATASATTQHSNLDMAAHQTARRFQYRTLLADLVPLLGNATACIFLISTDPVLMSLRG